MKTIPKEIQRNGLPVSFDMGWNKRATGESYDSFSGHGFMIGCRTGNIVDFLTNNKKCGVCRSKYKYKTGPLDHEYISNWTRSSNTMEA